MNSFNSQMAYDLKHALISLDHTPDVCSIIITGNEKAFSCGADLKTLKDFTYQDITKENAVDLITHVGDINKPLIAAVHGLAMGGGFEVALSCDIIVAGEKARFALPETRIGTIPGAGGTQRLVRNVGKSKAMEMILTGCLIGAKEAKEYNLVSRIVPTDQVLDEAKSIAAEIGCLSLPIILTAKDSINRAYELPLHEGLNYERKSFHSTFALEDQQEGMKAFANKRAPNWKHK
eukprot:gene7978-9373_t